MIRRFTAAAIVTVLAATATAAVADTTFAYDTVDEVEASASQITITGVLAGDSAPTTTTYYMFASSSGGEGIAAVARCDRFATLAMSKPGKYRFAVRVPSFSGQLRVCKLSLRTP